MRDDVRDNDRIDNVVRLYQNDRVVDTDTVRAEPNPQSPEGRITKKVRDRKISIGERTEFDIEFTNVGDVDIVAYKIVDTWPADDIALVCNDRLYSTDSSHDQSTSRLR